MKVLAIILGAVLIDVAVRGTFEDSTVVNGKPNGDGKGLWPLLKGDFEPGNKGNFLAWFAAILVIGMIGYIPELKPIANTMLVLVILVLLISNGGFFAKFEQQVLTPAPSASTATQSAGGA